MFVCVWVEVEDYGKTMQVVSFGGVPDETAIGPRRAVNIYLQFLSVIPRRESRLSGNASAQA